ncbi:sulfurtransferase complex subunit TusC [Aestuariirhabdus sp. Z084]|uniref:sulfurtransferase complex subunit TusC n=1 Tax=Aestuariirhabdus haliotis TaxID=2918751 RepID=UPI00201B39F0|nr:sulfurtransferase complex subunit TusC [Aestuariirhabdus haliotis]MCL6414874.1 sulfurtransferase complex subunit TusC [Aestuariirhabdus haliotis]MCL6418806.1 sulfurtransferase complex subunit TusC [Aestuariirhabdus haliotis]
MGKSLCLITSTPPYGTLNAKEALDTALIGAAFELEVSLVFDGDGIYQLLDQQAPDALGQKTFSATLKALELYGVEQLLVCDETLSSRGIKPSQLCVEADIVSRHELSQHLERADILLGF